MLTVGELKKYLEEENIPDDAFIILAYKDKYACFAQKFLERSVDFDESEGNRGICIRSFKYEEKMNEYCGK